MRPVALAAGFLILAAFARADDGIPPETVDAVKKATVFVRVQGSNWRGSGSGFVVSADKDSVLVATNYHVIASPDFEKKPRLTPADVARSLKLPTVTAVFDGGAKTERSLKAEAVAADPEADLAILRVTGLKDPPAPIDIAGSPKLFETMAVYSFGYPFGQALAVAKGNPNVTVGKGSVSSLRNDDSGELSVVQIDGALNPGNSGGPVVDTKGRLVGIAVATVKNGQGIGFAVPAAELGKMMKGRLGAVVMTATKAADGKLTVQAEVAVIDPTAAFRGVTLHYAVLDPKAKRPAAGHPVEKMQGAQKVALKIENGIARGELATPSAEADLYVQVVPDGGAGAAAMTRPRSFALAVPKGPGGVVLGAGGAIVVGQGAGEGVPPPPGWKEFQPRDKTYFVWIPEKPKGQSEKERTATVSGLRLKFNSLLVEMPGGPTYVVDEVILPAALAQKLRRDELIDAFRDGLADDARGRVTDSANVKLGPIAGKEFRVESDKEVTRARVVVGLSRVFIIRATGTKEQVDAEAAKIFLDSCRMAVAPVPKVDPKADPKAEPRVAPKTRPGQGRGPRIQGGGGSPEFRDHAPDGGLLVGFELGMGKFANLDTVVAVRPIYRVGDKEVLGRQYGTDTSRPLKLLAKPGYAVGAISLQTGIPISGLSVTFMKVADGKLDPKDSYESEWAGSPRGGFAVKIGDGTPVVGILGKATEKDAVGLGLIYTDTAKQDAPWPAGKPTVIHGGAFDAEFRDGAPAGGLLVGLELGLGKFVNNDIIKAVRPVYRVGDKESTGTQYGTELKQVTKVVAKAGYAVGAITVKTGLGVDGVSITFMKVTADGKLDPKDSYESEWVGGMGGGGPTKIGGDGTPVVGVVGRTNGKDANGLGLLLKDEKK